MIADSLGWLTIVEGKPGLPELAAFAPGGPRNGRRVVVLGMGGSSLAPLVFASSFRSAPGHPALEVLDSTEPSSVRDVADRCDPAGHSTSSPPSRATTLEPNIFFDYFYAQAERSLGAARGAVRGRDGSWFRPGAGSEAARGARDFPGGPADRWKVLGPLELRDAASLPSRRRREGNAATGACHDGAVPARASENPGALLGAAMGALAAAGRDKLTFSVGRPADRFGMWAEQLIAESTGKEGRGILPVEGEPLGPPESYGERPVLRPDRGRGGPGPSGQARPSGREGHPTAIRRGSIRSTSVRKCFCGSSRRRWRVQSSRSTRSISPTCRRPRTAPTRS